MQNRDHLNLAVYGLLFIGIIIYIIFRARRKKKDIYGFQLPDWNILIDDQRLYEIEQAFKFGTLSKTLNQTGFAISDWHSNFEHKTKANHVTGFIQLSKYASGLSYNNIENQAAHVITHIKTEGYRYLWAKLSRSYERLIHINTGNYISLENNQDVQKVSSLINELELIIGPHSWHIIFYKDDFFVLIDELWTQNELDRFLKIGFDISEKLSIL
jgi:hypothetical protein